jgi:hypothetical protein
MAAGSAARLAPELALLLVVVCLADTFVTRSPAGVSLVMRVLLGECLAELLLQIVLRSRLAGFVAHTVSFTNRLTYGPLPNQVWLALRRPLTAGRPRHGIGCAVTCPGGWASHFAEVFYECPPSAYPDAYFGWMTVTPAGERIHSMPGRDREQKGPGWGSHLPIEPRRGRAGLARCSIVGCFPSTPHERWGWRVEPCLRADPAFHRSARRSARWLQPGSAEDRTGATDTGRPSPAQRKAWSAIRT